jgi:O-antigen ligase
MRCSVKWRRLLRSAEGSRGEGPAAESRISAVLIFFLGCFLFFSTFSIAGTQISLTLAILAWVILAAFGRSPRPSRTLLDIPILFFVLSVLLSVIFSEERMASFLNLKNLPLVVIIYLFGFLVRDPRDARGLFIVLLVSGAASSLFGIAIFFLGRGGGFMGRTPGSFSTAMTFGGITLLLCSLFSALAAGRGIGRRMRLACMGAAAASLTALFLTFTRSSWLGMFVSLIAILAILRKKFLIPFLAAVVIFVMLLPKPYRDRVTSIWDLQHRTTVQRIEMIKGGWSIFKEHPVFGVGTMDLAPLYERHKPPEAVHVHGHMHNIFVQVAVTTGTVGLAAFCYLLISFFRLLAGNLGAGLPPPLKAWTAGSIGALAGFITNGLFEWNFGDAEVVMMLYFIIGSNLALFLHRRAFENADST